MIKIIIFICILIIIVLYFRNSLDRAVYDYANTDVKNIVSRLINEAVIDIIDKNRLRYDDISEIAYDTSGNISSVSLKTSFLNTVRSETVIDIIDRLSELKYRKYGIPFGNILGTRLSSGKGFKIGVTIVPLGSVASETRNEFISAGINQTLHRIVLDITATVSVLAPFSSASADVRTSVCLAETVIIGKVPGTYFSYTSR